MSSIYFIVGLPVYKFRMYSMDYLRNCKASWQFRYRTEFCIMALVIFRTRKDQNKSKFKEKIQHYQFDLTFYGICTSCFIFQQSI